MARRPRLFAPGLLYHVIVRGNQRQKTFLSDADYQAYLERLGRYRRKFAHTLHAFCLMPNHVHLLLETSSVPLPKFMQGLQQSYTQFFNRRHRKVGHLFQGRYQAIVCEKDRYLLALVRYIHLNPIRAGLARNLDRYPYSGHHCYLTGRATAVLDPTRVLRVLGGRTAYQRLIRAGLKEGHKEEYYQVEDQRFLGTQDFAQRIKAAVPEMPPNRRATRPLDRVLKDAARALAVAPAELASPDRSWHLARIRVVIAYLLVRRFGYRLTEVATALGRDGATLSSRLSRLAIQIRQDKRLRHELAQLEHTVAHSQDRKV